MVERQIHIPSAKKLDSQGASRIANQAGKFRSAIYIEVGTKTINAKSVMGVLTLGMGTRRQFTITADGRDEADAVEAMARILEEQFA